MEKLVIFHRRKGRRKKRKGGTRGRKKESGRHTPTGREKEVARPAGENKETEGRRKGPTAVHGYRELHNSWPFHNGAAPGCGRADGMSFSPFAAEKTILLPILSPRDTLLSLSLSLSVPLHEDLFFASKRLIRGFVCRVLPPP